VIEWLVLVAWLIKNLEFRDELLDVDERVQVELNEAGSVRLALLVDLSHGLFSLLLVSTRDNELSSKSTNRSI